jgi:cold shock CspA family protein
MSRPVGKDGRVLNTRRVAEGRPGKGPSGPPPRETPDGDARELGVIESVYEGKGYGFLRGADGKTRFFHADTSEVNLRNLRPGDQVSYMPTQGPKGPRAIDVRREG